MYINNKMYMTYENFCKKIFTLEGYYDIYPEESHILGKKIKLELEEKNYCIFKYCSFDEIYYVKIFKPHCEIWKKAITNYDPDNSIVYCDGLLFRDNMIVNSINNINMIKPLIDLYELINKEKKIIVVEFNGKIYLTTEIVNCKSNYNS